MSHDPTAIIAPKINENGTLKSVLLQQLAECLYAVQETERRLMLAAPVEADYGVEEFKTAQEQHETRIVALQGIGVEIAAIQSAVAGQDDDRPQELVDVTDFTSPRIEALGGMTVEQALRIAESDPK